METGSGVRVVRVDDESRAGGERSAGWEGELVGIRSVICQTQAGEIGARAALVE